MFLVSVFLPLIDSSLPWRTTGSHWSTFNTSTIPTIELSSFCRRQAEESMLGIWSSRFFSIFLPFSRSSWLAHTCSGKLYTYNTDFSKMELGIRLAYLFISFLALIVNFLFYFCCFSFCNGLMSWILDTQFSGILDRDEEDTIWWVDIWAEVCLISCGWPSYVQW